MISERLKRWVISPSTGSFPVETALISIGSVFVFTSPVVTVRFLIQRFWRLKSTFLPWTPTTEIFPPGLTIFWQVSHDCGSPTASIATSTPSGPTISCNLSNNVSSGTNV